MQRLADVNRILDDEYAHLAIQLRTALKGNRKDASTIQVKYDHFKDDRLRRYFSDILQYDLLRDFDLEKDAIVSSNAEGFTVRIHKRQEKTREETREKTREKTPIESNVRHIMEMKSLLQEFDEKKRDDDFDGMVDVIIRIFDQSFHFIMEQTHAHFWEVCFDRLTYLDEDIKGNSKSTCEILSMWADAKKRWKEDIVELGKFLVEQARVSQKDVDDRISLLFTGYVY